MGRRNLLAQRKRAVLAIAGVATALLMVLLMDAVVGGITRQLTAYIDTSPAGVFVAQQGVTNMHMATSSIPSGAVAAVQRVPGVAWADPIDYAPDAVVTAKGRELTYVVGYIPGRHGGPAALVAGREPGAGEVVIDRRGADTLGLAVGDPVRFFNRSWRVSGMTEGLTSVANTVVFVRQEDFAAATGVSAASYILVGNSGSADEVASRIATATGLSALAKPAFAAQERALARAMSATLLDVMTLAAFLIAIAVIGLALYTSTLSRLREAGVMKALGATQRRLAGMVLSQAMWTVSAAFVTAAVLSVGLGWTLEQVTRGISVVFDPTSILEVAGAAALLAAVGAMAPLLLVWRVEPAVVFRRRS